MGVRVEAPQELWDTLSSTIQLPPVEVTSSEFDKTFAEMSLSHSSVVQFCLKTPGQRMLGSTTAQSAPLLTAGADICLGIISALFRIADGPCGLVTVEAHAS